MNTTLSNSPITLADALTRRDERDQTLLIDAALVISFAVLTAAAAQIRFNLPFTPVPITGQTFVVLLAGTTLGMKRGALSQFVYWAVGVFMPFAWYANDETGSSISEGWNHAIGTSAGYLFGFVAAAAAVGYLAERGQDRSLATSLPAMLAGSAIIYVFGAWWLSIKLQIPVATGETNAIGLGVVPFLIGDLLKVVIAGVAAPAAWRFLRRS